MTEEQLHANVLSGPARQSNIHRIKQLERWVLHPQHTAYSIAVQRSWHLVTAYLLSTP